ncbi:MAG: HNH endonuclease [Candidatus Thiodiazotropha endolucinida]
MNLYHYPKSKHVRTQTPYPYKNYSDFKPSLRKEFDKTCVYCRTPDNLSEKNYYAVEHYRPKRKFPELETEYTNLYYACGHCNSKKGEFWPTDSQLMEGIFIPNPCDHEMHRHLRTSRNGTVAHHSLAGRWTIDLLDINSPNKVKKRIFFTDIYNRTKSQITKHKKLITAIEKIVENADLEMKSRLETQLQNTRSELEKLKSSINYIENGSSE